MLENTKQKVINTYKMQIQAFKSQNYLFYSTKIIQNSEIIISGSSHRFIKFQSFHSNCKQSRNFREW